MAKPNKKETPLMLDEEKAERKKFYGMTKQEIEDAASAVRTQKQKSAEVSGSLSGRLEIFEKQGGRKSPLKTAEKVTAMEPAECADWFRAFLAYFDALGGNDQLDIFEQEQTAALNEKSVRDASKVDGKMAAAGDTNFH